MVVDRKKAIKKPVGEDRPFCVC